MDGLLVGFFRRVLNVCMHVFSPSVRFRMHRYDFFNFWTEVISHGDHPDVDLLAEMIASHHHVDLLDVRHFVGRRREDRRQGLVLDHIEEVHLLRKEISLEQTHLGERANFR
jgi:hypothetical protein